MAGSNADFSVSQTNGPSERNAKLTRRMGSTFMIDSRYDIRDVVGSGAYGVVASARDTVTGRMVAIKKIERAFEHSTFTKRTLRELKIMRLLNHENILSINSIQLPSSRASFNELYVVFDLMDTDLASIIKSPQPLTDEHCSFFLYQLLRGTKYMHSAQVLHRDLKPRNLLVNSDCDLKICDFGLARTCIGSEASSTHMTDYVATRWYRSPELLLTFRKYKAAMDMWSVGCIFAELLLRKPFLPGTDSNHQLELIFKVIGTPSPEEIAKIPQSRYRDMVSRLPNWPKRPFNTIFKTANPDAINLLERMLVFLPDERIDVNEALNHPYLAHLHVEEDEPASQSLSAADFAFERQLLTLNGLKDLIYEETLLYHFPEKVSQYEADKKAFEDQLR